MKYCKLLEDMKDYQMLVRTACFILSCRERMGTSTAVVCENAPTEICLLTKTKKDHSRRNQESSWDSEYFIDEGPLDTE